MAALAVIFDGFDIQILGFAIPSIMREWHLPRSDFAPVLAIGLAGMAFGSPLAGYLGDRCGRRSTLIGCVLLFGVATIATAFSQGLTGIAILRFLTGVGAGGALPNASTLAAEFAPFRQRPVAVTLTMICVPLGGMAGGVLAARILPALGWRALYGVGGAAPLLFALAMLAALPESPRYLVRHPGRWDELTRMLRKMGHSVAEGSRFVDSGEPVIKEQAPLKTLLSAEYRRSTLGIWFAFFSNLVGVYLVFGWLPAMLTAQGLNVATASSGLAAYNFGGILGVLLWAPAVAVIGSRAPLLLGGLGGAVSALALRFVHLDAAGGQGLLMAGLGLQGLFANAVQCNMFALVAHVYPTRVRASGMAFAGGVGRLGGLLSSLTGAAIIQMGSATYLEVLAASMFCTFVGLAVVRNHYPAREGLAAYGYGSVLRKRYRETGV